jgi:uncharacterized membrane protein YuzA (DUF378 family)
MMMRNRYDMIGRFGVLLAIAGAINWLLVGIFQWNLVQWAFTSTGTQNAGTGERIVYVIVGVGGLLAIPMLTASLARSRSRGIESEERDHVRGERAADDAQFYLGAPKNEREAARAAHASPTAEAVPLRLVGDRSDSSQEDQPIRIPERMIFHPEESSSSSSDRAAASSTGRPSHKTDASLRYGIVEETDEGWEVRRAA